MVDVDLLSPRNVVAHDVDSFPGRDKGLQLGNVDFVSSRAFENVRSMGLHEMVVELSKPFEPSKSRSSREATVDARNNTPLVTVFYSIN
ncbi:hypothetical protein V6N13_125452 [Hibiscus sabdariffa]|uniref:Uncharacterized protein n=1 Tax=Hibiscus sabdariffa TaxID=183260 RepID=A0ABR2U6E4_9ROSI